MDDPKSSRRLRALPSAAILIACWVAGSVAQQQSSVLPPAAPVVEDLVRVVLAATQEQRHIPDLALIPVAEPMPLLSELREFRLTERALPTTSDRAFRLVTRAALRAQARRRRRT
jgi:hypothetical protein